jgi:transposase
MYADSRASARPSLRLSTLASWRYVQVMTERHPYPSDLSDARWALIEPLLAVWRAERRRHALNIGRPPEHDPREIMNTILYVDRTGVAASLVLASVSAGVFLVLVAMRRKSAHADGYCRASSSCLLPPGRDSRCRRPLGSSPGWPLLVQR